jgi:predicted esterase
MSKTAIMITQACLAIAAWILSAQANAQELPGKPPNPFAPPHTAFGWNSKNDLRFVWWLPECYEPRTPRTMTVILHGRGFDYRWGWKNYPASTFRTDDIVLSVDGTSPDGEHRWFAPEKKDAEAFQAFLFEMTHTFAVERVLLYGHVEGGAFALFFAGEHPDSIAGLVAHDSNPTAPPKLPPETPKPAIVFMHGTLDPDAWFAQSLEARSAWSKAGFPLVHLRRLERSSYEPNPRRVNEELGWCDAMTSAEPELALKAALELLRVDSTDATRMRSPTDFGGAREILRRFEFKTPLAFASPDASLVSRAAVSIAAIEAAGAEQVGSLKKTIAKKRDLKLDGKAPIGHLAPMREDFRGVDSVEAYAKELGYDALFDSQRKPVDAILDGWRKGREPKMMFDVVLDNLPKAWLYEGLPPDLPEKLRAWKSDSRQLGLSAKALKNWQIFEDWRRGWDEGLEEYAVLWKQWKGP